MEKMAVRSGGSSLLFPHEFQMQNAADNHRSSSRNEEQSQHGDTTDIELGRRGNEETRDDSTGVNGS